MQYTIPNMLTAARIAMAFAAAWLAVSGNQAVAVLVLILAALLDAFDGWYARNSSQCSALGAHLDPLADKILMGVVFAWIGIEARSTPVWILIGLVAVRETGVTALRSYSLRRRGRFIPASGMGRVKMLTQSIVGLVLLGVMHFLHRSVPESVVAACLGGVLLVSYGSAAGYARRWREDEAAREGARKASAAGERHRPRRVHAGR